jgi:RNA polymerase sigma-70 factor, ECF subfamily
MPKTLTDEEMVALMVRFGGRMRAVVSALLPLSHDIDEVLQNSCLVAWRKFSSFEYSADDPAEEFLRWFCKVAQFEALNYRRKQSSREQLFDNALLDRIAEVQRNNVAYLVQQHTALLQCLERLTPSDRELVRQRYSEGVTVESMAGAGGRSPSAIYKALTRVRKSLSACVQRKVMGMVGA